MRPSQQMRIKDHDHHALSQPSQRALRKCCQLQGNQGGRVSTDHTESVAGGYL